MAVGPRVRDVKEVENGKRGQSDSEGRRSQKEEGEWSVGGRTLDL